MQSKKIRIIKGFKGYKKGSICFMTESSTEDVMNPYEPAFDDVNINNIITGDNTALRLLYEQISLGSSFPPNMILNSIRTPNHAFAAALFINPSLVLESKCLSLISSFNLYHKWGPIAFSHIPETHYAIIHAVLVVIQGEDADSEKKSLQQLTMASTIIESFLQLGNIPENTETSPSLDIIDSENDFVIFKSETSPRIWQKIYKKGFLCGIWVIPESNNKKLFIFKKSHFVPFDLTKVRNSLNAAEFNLGEISGKNGWYQTDTNPNIIFHPEKHPINGGNLKGTTLTLDTVKKLSLQVLRSS